eukprot:s3202_g1.t1
MKHAECKFINPGPLCFFMPDGNSQFGMSSLRMGCWRETFQPAGAQGGLKLFSPNGQQRAKRHGAFRENLSINLKLSNRNKALKSAQNKLNHFDPQAISAGPSGWGARDAMKAGSSAVLQGLIKRADLNGEIVVLKEWLQQKDRWLCQLPENHQTAGNAEINVKLENLQPIKKAKRPSTLSDSSRPAKQANSVAAPKESMRAFLERQSARRAAQAEQDPILVEDEDGSPMLRRKRKAAPGSAAGSAASVGRPSPSPQSGSAGSPSPMRRIRTKSSEKTVEQIYQKKTQLEHILLRPDSYVGSVERQHQEQWIRGDDGSMVLKQLSFIPALYKIFDEILVNAADNLIRDPSMDTIKISIDRKKCLISVWNNGKGLPIEVHKEHGCYVPELVFGHLLTSDNYNDSEKKVVGGRNGYGAKLTNIYSKSFVVETVDSSCQKRYRQVWQKNMTSREEPEISKCQGEDYTSVTFEPDLPRFGMTALEDDIVSLMERRAYDVAASTRGRCRVFLNQKELEVKSPS